MANYVAIAIAGARYARHKKRQPYTTEEDIQTAVRLAEAEVQILATEYTQWRAATEGINANFDASYTSVVQFLSYLARGGYFHQLALGSGIEKSIAIHHVNQVADFFASTVHSHIQLPDPRELPALSSPLRETNVLPHIEGFIVKIQRRHYANDACFCGRHGKSCDSINVQYVTDKHGKMRHIQGGPKK